MNKVDNDVRNYITVKEYSEMCNVSYQSIYKKLKNTDNQLNEYVKYFNNQRMIHKQALIDINGIVEDVENKVESEVEQSFTIANEVEQEREEKKFLMNSRDELIEILKSELENKNRQIETLQEQLSNSQKLLAMEKQEKQALLDGGDDEKIGIVGHIKRLMFGKKSDKIEE